MTALFGFIVGAALSSFFLWDLGNAMREERWGIALFDFIMIFVEVPATFGLLLPDLIK